MNVLALFPNDRLSIGEALLISLIAILIVFFVLLLIIAITSGISKIMKKIDHVTMINPRPENALLDEDEDAVVAALVATIDYHNETNEDARLVSIKRIDE